MYESHETIIAANAPSVKQDAPGVSLLIRLNIKYIIKLLVLWMIPISILSLLAGFSTYMLISKYKTKMYMASTILLRYEKSLSRSGDVPYLYPEINLNTLLETVKLPQNLAAVIDKLGLDVTQKELFDAIYVTPGNRSNTIHIFVYDPDANKAALIANTISEVYIEAYSRIFNSAAGKMHEYYLSQREVVMKEVNEAEVNLLKYRDKFGLFMADEELKLKLSRLSEIQLKLEEAKLSKLEYQSKVADLKTRIAALPDKVKISETMTSQREKEKLSLERDLELKQKQYTELHPDIINLKTKIKQLEAELSTGSETAVNLPDSETFANNPLKDSLILAENNIESNLNSVDEQIAAYGKIIETIQRELRELSSVQEAYFNLKQKVDSSRDLLNTIDKRISEARIARDASTHDIAILERAEPPLAPESTGRKLMSIISMFGIAFICLVFVMAYAIFSPGVKVPSDLDSMSAVEFIGVLPKKKNSTLTTYFSTLQVVVNRLDDHLNKNGPTLVTVSSLKAKEGKSTIIDDITDMKAASGKKALILKRIRESEYNRSVQVPGNSIVDLSSIRNDASERPKPVELSANISRLYYIVDRNISKINISPETVTNFVNNYNEYDYIFIELFSPKRNFQVASCIIRMADYNIMVTRYGKNSFSVVDKITKSAVHGTKRKIGTVINCGDLSLA